MNSEAHDNAFVQRRYLVLVLCDVSTRYEGKYSCISPAEYETSREEESMQLRVVEKESGGGPGVDGGVDSGGQSE